MNIEKVAFWLSGLWFLMTEKEYSLWLINKLVDILICTSASYELSQHVQQVSPPPKHISGLVLKTRLDDGDFFLDV